MARSQWELLVWEFTREGLPALQIHNMTTLLCSPVWNPPQFEEITAHWRPRTWDPKSFSRDSSGQSSSHFYWTRGQHVETSQPHFVFSIGFSDVVATQIPDCAGLAPILFTRRKCITSWNQRHREGVEIKKLLIFFLGDCLPIYLLHTSQSYLYPIPLFLYLEELIYTY